MTSRALTTQLTKVLIITTTALIITACSGSRPMEIGVTHGVLAPCPSSPNCVSSFAKSDDETHYIAPLAITSSSAENSWDLLRKTIGKNTSAKIITDEENYIYAEYTSSLMRYVDDTEFLLDADKSTINVRSASRLGYRDFDVNRERIESIRMQLNNENSQ